MRSAHLDPAFQASSPKLVQAGSFAIRPFFCPQAGGKRVAVAYLAATHRVWDTTMADIERSPRRLQVANMRPEDSGRGLARVPRATLQALGLNEGGASGPGARRPPPERALS